MAEETNKKSIIASDDNYDEYSCVTVSEQTELTSILDTLSLGPKKEKKKLLIFSPSGILLHRAHKKNRHMIPKNRSPDASQGSNLVYKRPFAQEFIKFCLERFEVGIWSSAYESNVDIILDIALEDLKDKLLFVWGQKHCTNSGLNTLEHTDRPMFFKDLSKVFQRFREFSASNTVLIDDEPYKALLNPDNTGLFPVTYDPTDKNDDFLDPEGDFCSYLDDLANSSDVQACEDLSPPKTQAFTLFLAEPVLKTEDKKQRHTHERTRREMKSGAKNKEEEEHTQFNEFSVSE